MEKPKNDKEWREHMAQQFIHVLEMDGLSWKKKWMTSGNPVNGGTKYVYKGINAFYLSLLSMVNGWGRRWYTFTQITDTKGFVHKGQSWKLKKGSKATYVEYWYPFDIKARKMVSWQERKDLIDAEERTDSDFLLRARFTPVFNESQIEGIPSEALCLNKDIQNVSDVIIKIANNMKLDIKYDGGDKAFYRVTDDSLHLPKPEMFESQMALNATALHELAHASGHESRLNRNVKNVFGSDEYAFEELVAEMTSCFMSIRLPELEDDDTLRNHQAYVKSWISDLQEQPDVLSKAIKEAMKAAEYLDTMAGIDIGTEMTKVA